MKKLIYSGVLVAVLFCFFASVSAEMPWWWRLPHGTVVKMCEDDLSRLHDVLQDDYYYFATGEKVICKYYTPVSISNYSYFYECIYVVERCIGPKRISNFRGKCFLEILRDPSVMRI
jgi:hypothetical protein